MSEQVTRDRLEPWQRQWPWSEGIEWENEPCDYCPATPRCVGSPRLCYGCLLAWAYIGPQYEEAGR